MKRNIKYIVVSILMLLSYQVNTLAISLKADTVTHKTKSAILYVHIKDVIPTDTVSLYYWTDMVNEAKRYLTVYHKLEGIKDKKGNFRFEIPDISGFVYFDLSKTTTGFFGIIPFLETYIAEPGDSVLIDISRNMDKYGAEDNKYDEMKFLVGLYKSSADSIYKVEFSGRGALKYDIRFNTDKISYPQYTKHKWKDVLDSTVNYNKDNYFDFVLDTCFTLIDARKSGLSPLVYSLLKTDIFSRVQLEKMTKVTMAIDSRYNGDYNKLKEAHHIVKSVPDLNMPDTIKSKSKNYTAYLYQKELFQFDHWKDRYNAYWSLKNKTSGNLKERVLTDYLVRYFLRIKNVDSLLADAERSISYPPYKEELLKIQESQTGKLAYDFKLPDANGNIVQLSSFKGKWVFMDFWYTGCSNCASYYEYHLSKVEEEFKNNPSIVFITVSIDTDKKQWITSLKSGQYTSNHALNLYTNGLGVNHDVIKKNNVFGYPQPIMIDPKGRIYRTDIELRNGDKLNKIIIAAVEKK